MGKEDGYVKSQVAQAAKITFTKHNAFWLTHTPGYPPVNTEVLITENPHNRDDRHHLTTQVSETTSTAYCLEIIEKSVYQFEKRITRRCATTQQQSVPGPSILHLYCIRTYQRYHF